MRFVPKLAVVIATMLLAGPVLAGPFAEVGDKRLRQDVDLLKAEGLIKGPVDSWPLPWAQIDAGLNVAHDGRELDPYIRAAVDRLEVLSQLAAKTTVIELNASATNNVSVARNFGSLARAKLDGSASAELNTGVISVAAGVGIRSGQNGKAYNFEPSQVAIKLGNWALYGGWTEEWFGPGQDGALLFSNSTRPFPKIGIKRLMPDPINLPVLRWLGPIRLDLFVGLLDEQRDFRNTVVVGTRVSFTPTQGLEIGLNRAQMLCGQGRPCGFKQIKESFIGFGNADNPTAGDQAAFLAQPGNQIAGFDLSYTHRFGTIAAKFYMEAEAEDFDNVILEQYARLIGTTLSGPWGSKGSSWTATLEYADTYGAAFFNGTPLEKLTGGDTVYPGSLYNNGLYTSGFTYNGSPIGYWADGDSRDLSLSGSVTDTRNRRFYGSMRSIHLNITNVGNPPLIIIGYDGLPLPPISYRVSVNSEKFAILTAGTELPTHLGDLHFEARYQTDLPNTPNERKARVSIEIGLRERF